MERKLSKPQDLWYVKALRWSKANVGTTAFLAGLALFLAIALPMSLSTIGSRDDGSDSGSDAPASACVRAMERAASVPLDQTNDDEMADTATACETVEEWRQAAFQNPAALGLTTAAGLSAEEWQAYVDATCYWAPSARMCGG